MSKALLFVASMWCFGLLSGCSTGPAPIPFHAIVAPPGKAVVYVYRGSNSYVGSAVTLNIDCDGKWFGVLTPTGYTYTLVQPGLHEITSTTEISSTVHITAVAGHSYFVEAEVEVGIWIGRPRLTAIPEDAGKLAIAETCFCPMPPNNPRPKPRR